jgi:hypothetical protein
VIEALTAAGLTPLLAVTVNAYGCPLTVGVPVRNPVDGFNAIPVGSEPDETVYVGTGEPDATKRYAGEVAPPGVPMSMP